MTNTKQDKNQAETEKQPGFRLVWILLLEIWDFRRGLALVGEDAVEVADAHAHRQLPEGIRELVGGMMEMFRFGDEREQLAPTHAMCPQHAAERSQVRRVNVEQLVFVELHFHRHL